MNIQSVRDIYLFTLFFINTVEKISQKYLFHSAAYCFGVISIFLFVSSMTASSASLSIPWQLTYHCGLIIGSTTSLLLEHSPSLISFFSSPLYSPCMH
ncbi:hypothetical protein Hanom_Chr07g00652281 [Helianthus anomalus]